jgi:WS/DGAT/MGAT family acyltransferase
MARYTYERLSHESASLLEMETSRLFAHTGTTLIFEPGPLARSDGGVDFEALRGAIESRLPQNPIYRRKLRWIPIENHPVWVDDHEFHLGYHVRHTSLPRPGSMRQLRRLVARVQAQRLDRSRPLWEFWVVEGLEGGRFALLTKTHGALLASAGSDLLQVLLSTDPDTPYDEPPLFRPEPMPSVAELVRDELMRQVRVPRRAMKWLRAFASSEHLGEEIRRRAHGLARALGYSIRGIAKSPLNGPIGPHRRFDHLVLPLDDAKQTGRRLGGSVLDVVLTVVTGALARYLKAHYVNPATLDFRVAVPVGIRSEEGHETVDEWILELPVWERDTLKRFERIRDRTQELNRRKPARTADDLLAGSTWTLTKLPAGLARAMPSRAPVNMRIANVPCPQVPLYLKGARMVECYGKLALAGDGGLGIAVYGYDGKLCWGLNADFDLVPDLARFTHALGEAHRELVRAASGESPLSLVRVS